MFTGIGFIAKFESKLRFDLCDEPTFDFCWESTFNLYKELIFDLCSDLPLDKRELSGCMGGWVELFNDKLEFLKFQTLYFVLEHPKTQY
jgi:hypothetical protein